MSDEKKPRKTTSVRHTRAIQRDRSKRPTTAPPDEEVQALLTEVVHPATYTQMASYAAMGMRQRILTLPVMVAFVLSLIWRQIGSVSEAVRVLKRQGMLWTEAKPVSQQAVSERLRTFPAELFYRVLLEILPQMQQRWQARKRPLSPAMAWALEHFPDVLVLDGSTLDALLRKVGLLREGEGPVLAGRIAALVSAASLLPRQVWYEENSQAHDQIFWERAVESLSKGVLLLFDLGFTHYDWFDRLSLSNIWFVTRIKSNAVYQVERMLHSSAQIHDWVVRLGQGPTQCATLVRLIEIQIGGRWYRYLTNVLDPQRLPAEYVAELYGQRWRIEDAFNVVKRLLGLAYFWVGSINGVQVQVWGTWILYAVLVDLTDQVAEVLHRPFSEISIEMVFRGLYHFTLDYHQSKAKDPVQFLADEAEMLGIIKRKRRPKSALTDGPDP
ncbi:MAG TPA: IS4 family transposase [Anaerolineales bacterium]